MKEAFREAFGDDDRIDELCERFADFIKDDALLVIAETCSDAEMPVTVGAMLFAFASITYLVRDGHMPREVFMEMAANCWKDETEAKEGE